MAAPLQIGRYVLHGEIASGGMASVHFGRLVGTGGFARTVAIKRLHRTLAGDESLRSVILEEGRLAARIRHPNVVPPLDVVAEGGELLLVMEYVHGESLARLLRSAGEARERVPLPVGTAILANVLHGLHAAHEARDESGKPLEIVHRDVSPQNIIVGVDGIARVIDFGIAKAVTSEEVTTAGTIKGKVPYLAPEQLEGQPATRRTDIYAAAVVFWEVLAGRRLFGGRDDGEVLRNIMTMEVQPPSAFNPLVARTVDDVVLEALARDPKHRFATARAMAVALEAAVHLATATVVGAWTERLAAVTLAERAERIREIEAAPLSGRDRTAVGIPAPPAPGAPRISVPAPPAPGAPHIAVPAPPPPVPARAAAPPLPVRASTPPVRPPAASRPAVEPRTVIYEPPPMPEPEFVHGVRPLSADPPAPPPAGALRMPALAIRNVDWLAPPLEDSPPPRAAFKRFLRYLAAFLAFALITAWMFAPAIARAWIVTGAAERGITLTIDRVDVSRRAVRLSDVRAESTEMPGAAMRTGTIVIGLRWLMPEKLSFDDAEVTLDGPYSTVAARLDQYQAKHGVSLTQAAFGIRTIEITSGRINWNNVIGVGTSALLENVTLDVGKDRIRSLGDDYHLSAPLFRMQLAGKPAGPWQLDVVRQGILVRSVLRFDSIGVNTASVTRTVGDDGSVSVALSVPPTSLSDLHVPAAVFGGAATDKTRLEAHGDINIGAAQRATTMGAAAAVTNLDGGGARADAGDAGAAAGVVASAATTPLRSVSGHVVLAAGSLNVFPTGPLVDLSLDLPLVGDTGRPIAVSGVLAVAAASPLGGASSAVTVAAMTGHVDLSGRAAKVEMNGTTGSIACVGPAPRVKASENAGSTGLRAEIAGMLDDLPGAQVHFVPLSACMPKLN